MSADTRHIEAAIDNASHNFEGQRAWLDCLPSSIDSILDIGCGPGIHAKYFKDRGMTPTGIDTWREVFQYHREIEHFTDLGQIPESKKFDAVFCSHILEHCPNPLETLQTWSKFIKEDGYLIIIVPKYDPRVCNDHWITGWGLSQLAMFLVASGFDCRESTFSQSGLHVCGYGKRTPIEKTNFNINASLPYLPQGLANLAFSDGPNVFLAGDLAWVDSSRATYLLKQTAVSLPSFSIKKGFEINPGPTWRDFLHTYPPERHTDFSHMSINLIILSEGRSNGWRLAIGSGSPKEPFGDSADLWFSPEPGFNSYQIQKDHFKPLHGDIRWTDVSHFAFGGPAGNDSIKFWLTDESGNSLI